jgi:gamma-tubulin complex component 3
MIHFIRQMQAYTQLEVIACSWKALMEFFAKREGDLDAMIDAHQSYLDRMVKKVLLISSKAGKEVSLLSKQVYLALIVIARLGDLIDPSSGSLLNDPSVP